MKPTTVHELIAELTTVSYDLPVRLVINRVTGTVCGSTICARLGKIEVLLRKGEVELRASMLPDGEDDSKEGV